MFDRVRAADAVDALDPAGRGRVATACLLRVAELVEDPRIDGIFQGPSTLVRQIVNFSLSCINGGIDRPLLAPLNAGVREFLGPDETPYEEPPGWGAWVMDIVSLADYVMRTWADPGASSNRCFNVLLAAYSIVSFVEDESGDPGVPPLGEGECEMQMDDIAAVEHGRPWQETEEKARRTAHNYAYWLRAVAAP